MLKQKKEIIPYEQFLANGLKMISDKKGDLIRLAFKEYEPLNIICNVLQIPQIYSSAQTLVILQNEANTETPICVYVLNINDTEVSKTPTYSEMAEM